MVLLLLVILAVSFAADAAEMKKEHSLHPLYPVPGESEAGLENWLTIQDAAINANFIRLTPDEPHKSGAVWNFQPTYLNDWEFHVDFQVHGAAASGGNGFALWYSKDPYAVGPVFGHMDYFSGLGVFIDTNDHSDQKHAHPYISAVVNNGSLPYSHGPHGTLFQVGGCHLPVRSLHGPAKIAVSYINKILTVFVDLGGNQQGWQICLRSEGIHLPTGYYLGVTASTGDNSDNHDIVAITTLDMQIQQQWEDRSLVIPHAEYIELLPNQEETTQQDVHHKHKEESTTEKQTQQQTEEKKPKPSTKREAKESETKTQPPMEGETAKSSSLLKKLVYLSGGSLILYAVVKVFRSYLARRRERMHKRLF